MDPWKINLELNLQQGAAAETGYAAIADLQQHVKIHPENAEDIQNILIGGRSVSTTSTTLSAAHVGYASSYPATGAGTSSASTTSMQLSASTPGDGGLDSTTQQALNNTALTGTMGPSQQTSSAADARHACAVCNKTFGRVSDLHRHAAKHDATARRHDCLIGGCGYHGPQGFYRRDKLLAHQRTVHGYTL